MAWEDLVKGYEYEKGRFVVLTKEDSRPRRSKGQSITILDFVRARRSRSVFRDALLSRPAERRAARVRAAARSPEGVRPRGHRQDRHPRGSEPRRLEVIDNALVLTRAPLRRRVRRHRAARRSRRRKGPKGRARHGEDARQESGGGMGSFEVHRRVSREPDEAHPGAHEGRAAEARSRRGANRDGKVVDLMERLRQSLESRPERPAKTASGGGGKGKKCRSKRVARAA